MLRRIPELFAFVDVSYRLGTLLFETALKHYEGHGWYGGVYRGERPAAILRTSGTDTVAHCLAFTTMHLAQRVANSGVRGYANLDSADGDRLASRLAGLFSSMLVDRLVAGILTDDEGIGFAERDRDLERTLTSYRAVAEIMYPDSREMRVGVARVDAESLEYWQRALDHALFLNAVALEPPAADAFVALVRTIGDTLDSFYLYFLASTFGEAQYERYGV